MHDAGSQQAVDVVAHCARCARKLGEALGPPDPRDFTVEGSGLVWVLARGVRRMCGFSYIGATVWIRPFIPTLEH